MQDFDRSESYLDTLIHDGYGLLQGCALGDHVQAIALEDLEVAHVQLSETLQVEYIVLDSSVFDPYVDAFHELVELFVNSGHCTSFQVDATLSFGTNILMEDISC